jgi:hypothetical protein
MCVSQIFLYSNELAERGVKKMEKKNVVFTKDGAKVGVKEVSNETYADKTQRAFVKTWNAAHDGWVVDDWIQRASALLTMSKGIPGCTQTYEIITTSCATRVQTDISFR